MMIDFKSFPPCVDFCLCYKCTDIFNNDTNYWIFYLLRILIVFTNNIEDYTIQFRSSLLMCDSINRIVEGVSENE